jgi:acetyl-CoA carboxylase carboxyl transferase subunit alpha
MKVKAADLKSLGIIDAIVPEPMGGAHRDHAAACANLGKALSDSLAELEKLSRADVTKQRHAKFLAMGQF